MDNINIQLDLESKNQNFALAGVINTPIIQNCNLTVIMQKAKQLYGFSQYISILDSIILNTAINFTVNEVTKAGYSLTNLLYTNLNMINVIDVSKIISYQDDVNVSMIYESFYDINIRDCIFKQYFESQQGASLLVINYNGSQQEQITVQINQCYFKAVISSNIQNGYGLIKQKDDNIQITCDNVQGVISGAYIYLDQNKQFDQKFEIETINVQIQNIDGILIDNQLNINNTKIQFNNEQLQIDAIGQNISLIGQRNIYYGIQIISSQLNIKANQLTLLQQQFTQEITLSNLYFDLNIDSTTQKLSGLGLIAQRKITLNNCTYIGNITTTGSIYLLFEETQQLVSISDLTINVELNFQDDSYGLIKYVKNGININNINMNIVMYITGDTLVDSSLMFYQVEGQQSKIQNVRGQYGGYINSQICTSKICNIIQPDVNINIREISNITLEKCENQTIDSKKYCYQQVQNQYLYKLNGTIAEFKYVKLQKTYAFNYFYSIISLLGDSQIAKNTYIKANIINALTGNSFIGGIAAITQKSQYQITNTSINITYSITSSKGIGNCSDFFSQLIANATLQNVSTSGQFKGSINVGGIAAYLSQSVLNITNMTVNGSYVSVSGYCGGVAGFIENDAQTYLQNINIDNIQISSTQDGCGPVYGQNNGQIKQFKIDQISIKLRSFYNDCPIGAGIKITLDICPQKQQIIDINIDQFPYQQIFQKTDYNQQYTSFFVFKNEQEFNNTEMYVTLKDMTNIIENRSLFGNKIQYNNLKIILQNEANLKWNADAYCFSLLQIVINNETQSITNVYFEGALNGNNNANAGTMTYLLVGQPEINNVTCNVTKLNFYYTSGFIQNVNIPFPVFTNININASSYTDGMISGMFYTIHNKTQTIIINNGSINCTSNGQKPMHGIIEQINQGVKQTDFNNITIKLTGQYQDKQQTCYGFNNVYVNNLYFDNCSFDMTTNITKTGSALFQNVYSTGNVNFTNCNFTGYLQCISSQQYDIGTIEGCVAYGNRNITNCIIQKQKLIGLHYIGGLFGSVQLQTETINIDNTLVEAEISYNTSQSQRQAGGFIGYKTSPNSKINIKNSTFRNSNQAQQVSCDSMQSGYQYTIAENITCT